MEWQPHVTVACIVEKQGRFLMVREHIDNQEVLNQPAGHWESQETLLEAAVRETLEETGWLVKPEALVGIFHWAMDNKHTFLRFCFHATCLEQKSPIPLDNNIHEAVWLSHKDIMASRLRSPMVKTCLESYQKGKHFPLDMLQVLG